MGYSNGVGGELNLWVLYPQIPESPLSNCISIFYVFFSSLSFGFLNMCSNSGALISPTLWCWDPDWGYWMVNLLLCVSSRLISSFASVHFFACCCSDEDDDWLWGFARVYSDGREINKSVHQ